MNISIPNRLTHRVPLYAAALLLSIALLAAAGIATASAKSDARPMHGTAQGSASIDGVAPSFPGDPAGCFALGGSSPSCVIGFSAEFRATHLGKGEMHGFVINDWTAVLTGAGLCASSSGGEITFVAANGDELTATEIGGEVCIGINTFDIEWQITGGTGHFSDASGTIRTAGPAIVIDENGTFLPVVPMPATDISGQIGY